MTEEKKVRIRLTSERYELSGRLVASLFEANPYDGLPPEELAGIASGAEDDENEPPIGHDSMEAIMEGVLRRKGDLCEVRYEESELTGMEGSTTSVSFRVSNPGLVSMMRSGSVTTALIFEAHRRHICAYNTPLSPFEICVCSDSVENHLLDEGWLSLVYAIEIRGAEAERTHFRMEISPFDEESLPVKRPKVMISVKEEL